MYAKLPWHRRWRVFIQLITILVSLTVIALLWLDVRKADAYEYDEVAPLTMTEEQINELYNYVRDLEMENEHLKHVVNLSEQTLTKASEFAIKVDTQTQALIALYEHKEEVMDGMLVRYETALTRLDTLTDKYEKRIVSLERENGFWKVVGIAGSVAVGVLAGQ